MGQGVQVGRTVVSFELKKEESLNTQTQNKISKSTKGFADFN
jgi:hypothetical protein